MEKNQEFEVEIEGYNSEGQGIARVDGFVVFVPFGILGEVVKIHIIKVQKSFAVGKIVEIVKPSELRIEPKCDFYKKCGGCALQHIKYDQTLKIKSNIVKDCFKRIAKTEVQIDDAVCSNPYNYRNKGAFPLFVNENDNLKLCMFKEQSHNPVIIDKCVICDDKINNLAKQVVCILNNNLNLKQKQSVRHIVIRTIEKQSLVTIVSMQKIDFSFLYEELINNMFKSDDLGVFGCVKSKDNNVIFEGELIYFGGLKEINNKMLGIEAKISPNSFFQVNIYIMKHIYEFVVDNVNQNDIIIDAYSGAGLMSGMLAKKCKQVYGIEIVKEASLNADKLKQENKLNNLENINGDVAEILPKIINENKNAVLVLDPPRKGVSERVIETIKKVLPNKIIYVSCGPATLARDFGLLCEEYKIKTIKTFDMFAQTNEVETVLVLEKKLKVD